jgi:hypothetical protein
MYAPAVGANYFFYGSEYYVFAHALSRFTSSGYDERPMILLN